MWSGGNPGDGKVGSKTKLLEKEDSAGVEIGKASQKSWKHRSSRRKMVLGTDVGLGEVSVLSVCALVRRFNYWACSKTDIGWWMEKS
jgi:hypothetical protein